MLGKIDLVSSSWPNNFSTTRHLKKKIRHLLDKAFAHNLIARPGSSVEPKVLNWTRKNSNAKSCWVSETFVATL